MTTLSCRRTPILLMRGLNLIEFNEKLGTELEAEKH